MARTGYQYPSFPPRISSAHRPESPMEPIARYFCCVRCRCPVTVCSHCDRGQIYCGPGCSGAARKASMRAAGRRYQHSARGRKKHAERQRRYRARNKKVTHQGSPPNPASALLDAAPPTAPQATPRAQAEQAEAPRCCFCGCRCSPFLRLDYLHRSPTGGAHDHYRLPPPRGHPG